MHVLSYLYTVCILATQDLGKWFFYVCVPNTLLLTPWNSYLGNTCFRCNQISWIHLQSNFMHPSTVTSSSYQGDFTSSSVPTLFATLVSHSTLTLQWKSASRDQLFESPRTVARQAALSLEFSRQEYWSGLPFPPRGDFPNPGIDCLSVYQLSIAVQQRIAQLGASVHTRFLGLRFCVSGVGVQLAGVRSWGAVSWVL